MFYLLSRYEIKNGGYHMKFIKDLYYGNISPWEMIFERDSE